MVNGKIVLSGSPRLPLQCYIYDFNVTGYDFLIQI